MELDYTFMDLAQEYKVIHKNEEKSRISITPIGDFVRIPYLNEIIQIENIPYKVTYIRTDNRITLEKLIRKE